MERKRILIFSLAYFPKYYGGAEVALKEVTDRIGDDIEFHMITMRFDPLLPKEERIGNVQVHRVGFGRPDADLRRTHTVLFYLFKILFVPQAALAAWRLKRSVEFDGYFAMMSYMLFPIVLMRFFGDRTPYALSLQEGDPFEHVFERWYIRPFSPLLYLGFRNARVVQAISSFLAMWAKRYDACFTVVIPNGVDTARFACEIPQQEIDEARDALGKRMGDIFLVTSSRLVHKNAVDDVIRALPHLPEHVSFIVFGDGPDGEMLKKLARECGVEQRVQFRGSIGHDALPAYLKACDIFIRPSRSEGMGNSFIEAFAAGLPVIATQEGGIADFLFDEERNPGQPVTGFAVDKDSPEQIARQVMNIIEHPEKVRAVVRTAKVLALEKYDWDTIARDMRERVFGPLL